MPFSRCRTWALGLGLAASLGLGTSAASAQDKSARKLTDDQERDFQALLQVVDQVTAGKPAPSALTGTWHNDFLKALEGRSYIPFTVSVDANQLSSPTVALYVRVVGRSGTTTTDAAAQPRKDSRKKDEAAFEDMHFITLTAAVGGQHRLRRAFAVPAGEYDVYIGLREHFQGKGKDPKDVKSGVLKQSLTVPNFWSEELATSTVIVADRIEPAGAAPSQEQQAENPYTLGATRILPAIDTRFTRKEELSILFLVYNPALKANKPDVTIEYNFHQQSSEGEKYFNKTNPQQFNAQTLPPQFDMAAGHQLVAGQSVPLASFPEGDYRLEIKVTDNASGKNLTRDVKFTVAGS